MKQSKTETAISKARLVTMALHACLDRMEKDGCPDHWNLTDCEAADCDYQKRIRDGRLALGENDAKQD